MCRKMKRCMFLMVVLAISSGTVFADAIWNAGDGNWSTGSNWSTNSPPKYGEVTRIGSGLSSNVTVTVNSAVSSPAFFSVGRNGEAGITTLNIDTGADLRTQAGKNLQIETKGIINVNGGVFIPWGAKILGSEVNINSGIMKIDSSTWEIKSGSVMTVNGGIFALSSLPTSGAAAIVGGLVDISGGRLRISGNRISTVEDWIESDFLVAYSGSDDYTLESTFDGTNTWVDAVIVPEPATLALLGFGSLLAIRRRNR